MGNLNYIQMKRPYFLSIFTFLIFCSFQGFAQGIQINELRLPKEINGYQVLKCDFHMHTIFSDGIVWPTVRVNEAISDGLDAIAISDHLEYRPRLKEMNVSDTTSRNSAYRLAKKGADNAGLLLIPALEITKSVPPGHFNALFIKDADTFVNCLNSSNPGEASSVYAALKEARRQNAFVFWNHPWYKVKTNESIWFPIIDSLYNQGYFKGIEVINSTRYDPVVFGWAQTKKLTILSNTDSHAPVSSDPDQKRTITVVFAKERTLEAIHEALIERRTIAYCNNFLYGDISFLEAIFKKSIVIETKTNFEKTAYILIENNSSLSYNVTLKETNGVVFGTKKGLTILPNGKTAVLLTNKENFKKGEKINVQILVNNLQTGPGQALSTELSVIF